MVHGAPDAGRTRVAQTDPLSRLRSEGQYPGRTEVRAGTGACRIRGFARVLLGSFVFRGVAVVRGLVRKLLTPALVPPLVSGVDDPSHLLSRHAS